MPKRRAARGAAAGSGSRALKGKVVLVSLALCLTASGLTWAGWGRAGVSRKAEPYGALPAAAAVPAPPVPQSFSPASPSKEYVYAGGRLVATEEPTPVPLLAQTITFAQPPDKTFGDAPFALSATASSNLPVSFSITSGPATLSGNTVTIIGAGAVSVKAEQAGGSGYQAAQGVTRTFTVAKATPALTWAAPGAVTYGTPLSATQLNATAPVPGTLTYTPAAGAVLHAGAQGLQVSFAPTDTANYNVSAKGVTLTVNKAVLTVTAQDKTRAFGAGNPALTYAVTGFVNGDTQAGATSGQPALSTSATTGSPVGTYAITAAAGTLAAADYTFSLVGGTLTVTKAGQAITFAALGNKTFGDADFTLGAAASSGLGVSYAAAGQCTVSGATVHITGAGSCAITAAQGGNSNYTAAANVQQSFTIAKGAATLTLGGLTGHTYNGSPQTASVTTSPSGLSGVTITYNGSTTAPTNAGSYTVAASLAHANYTASPVSGTMVVAKATPVLTWNNPADIAQGTALSATQLNATANTSGTFAYTPAAGTVLGVGLNQTLSTSFTPADAANYNPATKSVQINVYACPKAQGSSFTRAPSPVAPGTPSTLSWNVPNATVVTIGGVTGTFGTSGSTNVTPAATTTYTLTATGAAVCPALTMQTSVAVQACPTAAGSSFKVGDGTTMDPPPPNDTITIQQGGSALLIWSAPNATGLSIIDGGACPPGVDCTTAVYSGSSTGGAVTVSPAQTTTYTLNVWGAYGCAAFQKQVTVEVVPAECALGAYFNSSPPTGNCGGDVTLSWGVPGASSVTITDDMYGSPLGTFGASGMVGIVPPMTFGALSYTLTAQMGAGSSCQVVTLYLSHPCQSSGGGGGGGNE